MKKTLKCVEEGGEDPENARIEHTEELNLSVSLNFNRNLIKPFNLVLHRSKRKIFDDRSERPPKRGNRKTLGKTRAKCQT